MIRIGIVGLGKMGLSHLAMINAHPDVELAGICDSSTYMLDLLKKYTGIPTYTDFQTFLAEAGMQAIIIATPSGLHGQMVRASLEKGLHVFCEKPFCLDPAEAQQLAELATQRGLISQVGYHCRFVGAFQEVKKLLDANAIGTVTHVLAEAYGPVILRKKGSTWRTRRVEGGGCLYDYAAHPLDLLNWYLGRPVAVGGTVLNKVFSEDTEDEVFGTLHFAGGQSAQISVNWCDESQRKMSTKLTFWGTAGRIYADRQECQVYLRDTEALPKGYGRGWNVRYTTDLTEPVWFYLRGEEYSAQLDHFIKCIESKKPSDVNSFESAAITDQIIAMMIADSENRSGNTDDGRFQQVASKKRRFSLFGG